NEARFDLHGIRDRLLARRAAGAAPREEAWAAGTGPMLRLAADEDINGDIVRALRRREPEIDLVRVQDAGLSGADDAALPEWAAPDARVPRPQDVSPRAASALQRARAGQPMPGVGEGGQPLPIGGVIEDLLLLAGASHEGERIGRVLYLPLC